MSSRDDFQSRVTANSKKDKERADQLTQLIESTLDRIGVKGRIIPRDDQRNPLAEAFGPLGTRPFGEAFTVYDHGIDCSVKFEHKKDGRPLVFGVTGHFSGRDMVLEIEEIRWDEDFDASDAALKALLTSRSN